MRPSGLRVVLAGSLTALGVLMLAPGGATAAGTSIGDAQVLTGSASGSLPSAVADDWYVVYPPTSTSSVTVKITNTTNASPAPPDCNQVVWAVSDSDGTQLETHNLLPGTSFDFHPTAPSDRFFVELRDGNCNPGGSSPPSYTVSVTGGGGPPLAGPRQKAAPGSSLGSAGGPLQGHTAYEGTIPNADTNDWFYFYLSGGAPTVRVRMSNTTVNGSTDCGRIVDRVTDATGTELGGHSLLPNTAETVSVSTPGRYFVHLDDANCNPTTGAGVTYQVQLEPAAGLGGPPPPPPPDCSALQYEVNRDKSNYDYSKAQTARSLKRLRDDEPGLLGVSLRVISFQEVLDGAESHDDLKAQFAMDAREYVYWGDKLTADQKKLEACFTGHERDRVSLGTGSSAHTSATPTCTAAQRSELIERARALKLIRLVPRARRIIAEYKRASRKLAAHDLVRLKADVKAEARRVRSLLQAFSACR